MTHDPIVAEVRCPVHGFIGLTDLERAVVDSPAFQRLRRIKQLAWTDYVYPGASHSRFEHSLGVMHVATRLYDAIVASSESLLKQIYKYNDYGLAKHRQIVRLAALLHDVGHPPFSHATEALLPIKDVTKTYSLFPGEIAAPEQYEHEDYSVAIINGPLASLIEGHSTNRRNFNIQAAEVASLISKRTAAGPVLFWRDIISGQLDADRMDYLLRDSLHAGVSYGNYDLNRIISSVCAVLRPEEESGEPKIAVMRGGAYSAEALIVARYWMHKQVYFHKTRLACNIHLREAMTEILAKDTSSSTYPRPDAPNELEAYLKWDDYKVMSLLSEGGGGEHGKRLMTRDHYRLVCEIEDADTSVKDLDRSAKRSAAILQSLGNKVTAVERPKTLWYKTKASDDIVLVEDDSRQQVGYLSGYSALMNSINVGSQQFIYVNKSDAAEARSIYQQFLRNEADQARKAQSPENEMATSLPAPTLIPGQEAPQSPQMTLGAPIAAKSVPREPLSQKGVQNAG